MDNFYALINSDREHPISWVSIENEKKRKGLEDEIFLIIQMSDRFSTENQEKDESFVKSEILKELNNLLPCLQNRNLLFSDLKLWRLALPKGNMANRNEEIKKSSNQNNLEKPNEISKNNENENSKKIEIKSSVARSIENSNEMTKEMGIKSSVERSIESAHEMTTIEHSVNVFNKLKKHGIFVIGDGVGVKGRAEGAIISGIEAGEEIQSKLK